MQKKHFIDLITDKLVSLGLAEDEVSKQTKKLAQTLKILSDEDVASLIDNVDTIAQQIFILALSNSSQSTADSKVDALVDEDSKNDASIETTTDAVFENHSNSKVELQSNIETFDKNQIESTANKEKVNANSEKTQQQNSEIEANEKEKEKEKNKTEPDINYDHITDTMPTINNSLPRDSKPKNGSSIKGLNLVVVESDSNQITSEIPVVHDNLQDYDDISNPRYDKSGNSHRHSILEDLKQVEQKQNEFVDNYQFVQDIEPPEKVKATPMFWWTIALSTPITIPLIAAILAVFGALYVSLIAIIIAIIAALIAIVGAATLMALAPIIYGTAQAFSYLPVGLFEIGIGISIAGVAMFVGILLYNIAIRLCPYLIRKLSQLLKLSIIGLEKLFEHLKGVIAKI